jgi:DNA-binding MarR family transcriptional regulator
MRQYRHFFNRIFLLTLLILLLILVNTFGNVIAQGSTISGYVFDIDNQLPIEGAYITVSDFENNTGIAQTSTDTQGFFELSELEPGTYKLTIEADGYYNQTYTIPLSGNETYHQDVSLFPSGDGASDGVYAASESGSSFFYNIGMVLTIVLVISLVMYSKIKRENLLKNAIRNRIFTHIKENPGRHYRAILKDLDLPMGVLTYHINRLEKANYIKSRQDGMFRRFYTTGPKTEMRFFLSNIQESIINVIKDNKGISQTKIADKLGVSRKVVNYHINILDQAGLIFVETQGRESACYIIDSSTG